MTFPSPAVTVDCGTVVTPEPCPEPVEITIGGCQDVVEWDAGDLELSSLGRILQLSVTLKNICPYKRVALAVVLSETGAYGMEYPRGMKNPDHSRPYPVHLPGCDGPVHPVRAAGGSGCLGRDALRHL